jgi:predicted alpha/beta-fold hydrolase
MLKEPSQVAGDYPDLINHITYPLLIISTHDRPIVAATHHRHEDAERRVAITNTAKENFGVNQNEI